MQFSISNPFLNTFFIYQMTSLLIGHFYPSIDIKTQMGNTKGYWCTFLNCQRSCAMWYSQNCCEKCIQECIHQFLLLRIVPELEEWAAAPSFPSSLLGAMHLEGLLLDACPYDWMNAMDGGRRCLQLGRLASPYSRRVRTEPKPSSVSS